MHGKGLALGLAAEVHQETDQKPSRPSDMPRLQGGAKSRGHKQEHSLFAVYAQVLEWTQTMLEAGEAFCSSESATLRDALRRQSGRFFAAYHSANLQVRCWLCSDSQSVDWHVGASLLGVVSFAPHSRAEIRRSPSVIPCTRGWRNAASHGAIWEDLSPRLESELFQCTDASARPCMHCSVQIYSESFTNAFAGAVRRCTACWSGRCGSSCP